MGRRGASLTSLPLMSTGSGLRRCACRWTVLRVWEVYDDWLQYMTRSDVLSLDEALWKDEVSCAWVIWSGAAENAFADACQLAGGPVPIRGLVLGRGSARFREVRSGMEGMRVQVCLSLDTPFGRRSVGALSSWSVGSSLVLHQCAWRIRDCSAYYNGVMLYKLASVRLPSLYGYYACMVYWNKGALR